MAYLASKRMTYWGQFGILAAFTGAGLLVGGIVSLIPLLSKLDVRSFHNLTNKDALDALYVPENANVLRWVQFLTTLFLFFVPTVFYAWLCHKKPFTHLGFRHKVKFSQLLIVIGIMFVSLPFVNELSELTKLFPFSKSTFSMFQSAEDAYQKQVSVIGRMDSVSDFMMSLIMLAILPAMFEETIFRGGLQNLLARWWKAPIFSILVTAVIFSIMHGSYYGFLSRAALGFVLGWMYYRTGNLWLNIIAHAANNALAITAMYFYKDQGDVTVSAWWTPVSIVAMLALFVLFERVSQYQIDRPGQEVILPVEKRGEPSWVTE